MAGPKCPVCGSRNKEGRSFCAVCAAALEAGPEEPAQKGVGQAALGVLQWFLGVFPGLASPAVLLLGIPAAVVGWAVIGVGLWMFTFGAIFAAFAAGAVGVIIYWSAVTWLLCGYVCTPSEGMTEFRSNHWWAFTLLGFGPFLAIWFLMGRAGVG
jgi:hypothetical protein